MARLTVSLLGPPRIEVDGAPLRVDTRKAIALLAYLAVTAERQSRDTLATLLWPDHDTEHARAALRRTLSALAKGLGGNFLAIERTAIALAPAGVWLDVIEFRRLASDGREDEAIALYRGDFLSGFGLRDSIEFDDWQLFEAETLRREYAGVLERRARELAAAGAGAEAVELARRWLALDQLQEPAHRLLMDLYFASGERAAALRQYRECVRTLDAELGVAPLEETTALYESIRENARPPAPARPADQEPRPSAGPIAYPLVGRASERRQLDEALSRDGGCLVVVEGEAGIGKTRIVDEFADGARAAGLAVARAHCSETESAVAYAAVADLLRDAVSAPDGRERLGRLAPHWLAEATRLVPDLGGDPPPGEGPGARSRLLDGLSQAIVAAGQLLVVDDAQWLDEGSLEVLAYTVHRLRSRPVCLTLAWRSEDVPPGHPLQALLGQAQRAGSAVAVVLDRLQPGDVADLAEAAGAGDLTARLVQETDGLPLFVVEYLAAAAEAGSGDWPLPGALAELLRTRVAAASETSRQLLAAGAVLGRSFDLETVREVSGRNDEEVVSSLEELARRRLVGELADGYDFGHDRIRELVYADTSLARRRLLHRRAAEALVARERRDAGAQAAVIAEHYRLAGREAEAAEYFGLAGGRASALFAEAEAVAHFRAALALGHPDQAGLHEAIGDSLTVLGEYGAALASYETAAALAAGDRVGVLEHKLGSVHHRRGDWDLAAAHFGAAAESLQDGAPARLFADRSLNEHRRGNEDEALSLAVEALALAERAGDPQALAQAHNLLGLLASSRGETAAARDHLRTSLDLAGTAGDPSARIAALNNLALAERAAGNLAVATELTAEALALCSARGDRHREAALHNNLADLLHAAGRGDEAMAHLKQAVAIFAEVGTDAGEQQPEIWKLVDW